MYSKIIHSAISSVAEPEVFLKRGLMFLKKATAFADLLLSIVSSAPIIYRNEMEMVTTFAYHSAKAGLQTEDSPLKK